MAGAFFGVVTDALLSWPVRATGVAPGSSACPVFASSLPLSRLKARFQLFRAEEVSSPETSEASDSASVSADAGWMDNEAAESDTLALVVPVLAD